MSRRLTATSGTAKPIDRPFSNFSFAEEHFQASFPIRRLFSQARSRGCRTLVIEDVEPSGVVQDENEEILRYCPDFQFAHLKRVSFWKPKFDKVRDLRKYSNGDTIGYALLKHDICPSRNINRWHIFESVVRQYEHHHNYVPCARQFSFRAGKYDFEVHGVLYCQQNLLNKACAQVALRSACATYLADPDLTYSRINQLAFQDIDIKEPWNGLMTPQIPKVLNGFRAIPQRVNKTAGTAVWPRHLNSVLPAGAQIQPVL